MPEHAKRVSIGYSGNAYAGVYSVTDQVVKVTSRYGCKTGELGCAAANPQSVAQVLLREIVHASRSAAGSGAP